MKLERLAVMGLLMLLAGCATGKHMVSGQARSPIAYEAVQVYTNVPPAAVMIGMVSASNPDRFTQHWHPEMKKIRSEAALMGANGVLVKRTSWSFFEGITVSGFAFYVP